MWAIYYYGHLAAVQSKPDVLGLDILYVYPNEFFNPKYKTTNKFHVLWEFKGRLGVILDWPI